MAFAIAMTLTIVCSVLGDFFMKQAASPGPLKPGESVRVVQRLRFAAGIGMLTVHFIAFLFALKLAAVSVVIPLMACTYVGTTLLAKMVLREQVTPMRWAGITTIMLGVVLLFRST
jgi:multidrug transporter EmrE-like cation transporter